MRRSTDSLPVSRSLARQSFWIWLIPAALVAMALAVHGRWPIAIGIGLAAGLSLSGSV
jgi:hypothetical protein